MNFMRKETQYYCYSCEYYIPRLSDIRYLKSIHSRNKICTRCGSTQVQTLFVEVLDRQGIYDAIHVTNAATRLDIQENKIALNTQVWLFTLHSTE